MRNLIPFLLVLSACDVEENFAPVVDFEDAGNLTVDKVLATPDEVAAVIRTRAVLDGAVDLNAIVNTFSAQPPGADLATQCRTQPQLVWRETGCAGLNGWGYEVDVQPCDQASVIAGKVFWSYPDALAAFPPTMEVDEVALQMPIVVGLPQPDRVTAFAINLEGIEGGMLDVCGTAVGDSQQLRVSEVVDVDIASHNARMIFETQQTRVGDHVDARVHSDGSVSAQFPRGALVDPYRLEMTGFTRDIRSAVGVDGYVDQQAWSGALQARVTDATAVDGSLFVDGQRGPQIVQLPTF
ncbi:MAG: hypothetical protein AB8H79_02125 [Myxococcota bacterium]